MFLGVWLESISAKGTICSGLPWSQGSDFPSKGVPTVPPGVLVPHVFSVSPQESHVGSHLIGRRTRSLLGHHLLWAAGRGTQARHLCISSSMGLDTGDSGWMGLNLSDNMWFGSEPAVPGTLTVILINEKCPDCVHKAWASQQLLLDKSPRRSCQEGATGSLTQSLTQ